MRAPLVLSTDAIHSDAVAALRAAGEFAFGCANAADEPERLTQADVIIVRNPIPAELLSQAPRLRAVIRHGAGLDMIPLPAASEAGVLVANVPGVNANAVAEYAVAQMLNLARRLPQIESRLRSGSWQPARQLAGSGFELAGKTVSIVGVGAVGGRVASICKHGFGMKVLGHHPARTGHRTEELDYVSLSDALGAADFLVLSCPLNDRTMNLIGEAELALMKPTAFIVNVARGKVLDTAALRNAISSGRLAGATLDVFETQPLPAGDALFGLDGVRLSPHVAGISGESMRAMSLGAMQQAIDVLQGRFPAHWVNHEARERILQRWAALDDLP